MRRFPDKLSQAVLALCAVVSGCGGGSGGDSPSETPPPVGASSVNVSQAWSNLISATGSWQTTGIGPDGKTYTLSLQSTPRSTATFKRTGESGNTTEQVLIVSTSGSATETSRRTLYFNATNLFGVEYDDGSCSIVPILASPLPGMSPVGSTGSVGTSYDFDSCAPQPFDDGVTSNEWSIVSDSGITLFCITSVEYNRAGAVIGRDQTCIEATEAGALGTKARFTIYFSNTTALIAKNY